MLISRLCKNLTILYKDYENRIYENKFQIFDELNMKNIDIANIHFQGKAKKYLNNRAIKKYS